MHVQYISDRFCVVTSKQKTRTVKCCLCVSVCRIYNTTVNITNLDLINTKLTRGPSGPFTPGTPCSPCKTTQFSNKKAIAKIS